MELSQLKAKEQKDLLILSRRTLEENFKGNSGKAYEEFLTGPDHRIGIYEEIWPCFVTLRLKKRLRGCIGSLIILSPLSRNVHDYTLSAALRDPRFRPLAPSELSSVHIEITVLGKLKKLTAKEELSLGHHGLCVRYRRRQGVLLAQVATEQGWSVDEFIKNTCQKADLPPEGSAKYEIFFFEEVAFGED